MQQKTTVGPERSLADLGFSVFLVSFSAPFLEAPFSVFCSFRQVSGVQEGVIFGHVLYNKRFFHEKVTPSFFAHHYSVVARF